MKTANRPRRMPSGSILRFKPQRVTGQTRASFCCSFIGGPLAGQHWMTRTGPVLPITLRGGVYLPQVKGEHFAGSASVTWQESAA